jgi:hypothetical protein
MHGAVIALPPRRLNQWSFVEAVFRRPVRKSKLVSTGHRLYVKLRGREESTPDNNGLSYKAALEPWLARARE